MGLFDFGGSEMDRAKDKNALNQTKYGVADATLDPALLAQQQNFVNALQQQAVGLQQQANGQGPSLAGQMLQNNQAQNAANANSMIAGQRGTNAGMAQRNALMTNANANQAAAGQAAGARIQEQQNAQGQLQAQQGMLGGQLNNMQQQNVGVQGQNQNARLQASSIAQKGNAQDQQNDQAWFGSIMKGVGSIAGMFADGGPVSLVGRHLMASGGAVPALVSPGERYLAPAEVEKVAEGKKSAIAAGEKIPGDAKVKGAKNSYANDTVSKTLESGGIVIPRSITQSKDAPDKAAAFVANILGKQGLKSKKK